MRIIRGMLIHMFLIWAVSACSQVPSGSVLGGSDALNATPKTASACVLQETSKLRLLHQAIDEPVVINLYTHPCTGGLYLVEPNKTPDDLTVLHEGWWLQGLYRPQWRVTGDGRVLELYLTGVGPNGAEPFVGRISVMQVAGGWRVLEPEVDVPPPAHPKEVRHMGRTLFVFRDEAELEYMGLSNELWDVDFSLERLVLTDADVHSYDDAIAKTDGRNYFLQPYQDSNAFLIGITFTQPGVLWMVVPKDDRSIKTSPYEKAQAVCDECRAGAVAPIQRLVGYVAAPKH